MKRLSKDEYLWHIAFAAAKRVTCDRFRGGCVIARDGVLIATGYNGSAPGEDHCDDVGHDLIAVYPAHHGSRTGVDSREKQGEVHCVRTIHAEVNAIVNAAILGVSIKECDWFCTGVPCWACSRTIARLTPDRIFMCIDQGGVDDNKRGIAEWWRRRHSHYGTRLFAKTLEELVEMGVAE